VLKGRNYRFPKSSEGWAVAVEKIVKHRHKKLQDGVGIVKYAQKLHCSSIVSSPLTSLPSHCLPLYKLAGATPRKPGEVGSLKVGNVTGNRDKEKLGNLIGNEECPVPASLKKSTVALFDMFNPV